jgi:hypothetical protein
MHALFNHSWVNNLAFLILRDSQLLFHTINLSIIAQGGSL